MARSARSGDHGHHPARRRGQRRASAPAARPGRLPSPGPGGWLPVGPLRPAGAPPSARLRPSCAPPSTTPPPAATGMRRRWRSTRRTAASRPTRSQPSPISRAASPSTIPPPRTGATDGRSRAPRAPQPASGPCGVATAGSGRGARARAATLRATTSSRIASCDLSIAWAYPVIRRLRPTSRSALCHASTSATRRARSRSWPRWGAMSRSARRR